MPLRPGFDVQRFNRFGKEFLPGFVGLLITEVSEGLLKGELELRKALLAPNGYLHAGAIVSFADTLAGYGCISHLPGNAQNFTTVELKANFLNTAQEGRLHGEARAVHLGRTTQVWDGRGRKGLRFPGAAGLVRLGRRDLRDARRAGAHLRDLYAMGRGLSRGSSALRGLSGPLGQRLDVHRQGRRLRVSLVLGDRLLRARSPWRRRARLEDEKSRR